MARSVRRRKKQRFYWAEIGFLILGLIALRPSLVADLAAMTRPASPVEYRAVYDRGYYETDWRYQDSRFATPPSASQHVAYWPQYDTRPVSYPPVLPSQAVGPSNTWTTYQPQPLMPQQAPASWFASQPQTQAPASNVAWPDAQVHQLVHNGTQAPLVASPPWPITPPNPSFYPYPSTAPSTTRRY